MPQEDNLRQREQELKRRELELRLRELEMEVQQTTAKTPEVQEPSEYVASDLEDARPGRTLRRRWRRFVIACKFVGLALVAMAAVSVATWLAGIIIVGAIVYTAYQLFFAKN